MTPASRDRRPWPAPLAGRVRDDASAGQIADAIAALWQEIDAALHPVIGHRGVAALYNRSLHLAAAGHPWLAIGHQGTPAAVDLSTLKAALEQQAAAEAAAGGLARFESFHDLLASLVGASLTDRLLHSVWARSAGASPAQDTSS